MTKDEVYGVARAFLAALGGVLVSQGWIDAENAVAVSGALATIAAAVWSVKAKRK